MQLAYTNNGTPFITAPLTRQESIAMEGGVNVNIRVDLDDCVSCYDYDAFLDFINERATESLLSDVGYAVVDAFEGSIILNVTGEVYD